MQTNTTQETPSATPAQFAALLEQILNDAEADLRDDLTDAHLAHEIEGAVLMLRRRATPYVQIMAQQHRAAPWSVTDDEWRLFWTDRCRALRTRIVDEQLEVWNHHKAQAAAEIRMFTNDRVVMRERQERQEAFRKAQEAKPLVVVEESENERGKRVTVDPAFFEPFVQRPES